MKRFFRFGLAVVMATLAANLSVPSASAAQSPNPMPPVSGGTSSVSTSDTGPFATVTGSTASSSGWVQGPKPIWNGQLPLDTQNTADGTPQAISWGSGRIDIFWRGTDRGLWHSWFDGNWNGPEELSPAGTLMGDPQPVSWGFGRLDVFWQGANSSLWHISYNNGWTSPGPVFASPSIYGAFVMMSGDPHVVSWGPGRIDVFWQGPDGGLWHAWYASGWGGPEELSSNTMTSDPYPVAWGSGQMSVFWRGSDNNLWTDSFVGNWTGATSMGDGPLLSAPRPVSAGSGHIDVFWQGGDHGVWDAHFQSNIGWSSPVGLGGTVSGDPVAFTTMLGNIEVIYRNNGGMLFHDTYIDGWSGVTALGDGPAAATPTAATWSGHIEVFWRSTDMNIWHDWHDQPLTTRYIGTPEIKQLRSLDCEAAALQAALGARGTSVSQDWNLAQFGADLRPAVVSHGNVVQWGDPFSAFVGNVNGSEPNFSGYGVYWPPLQRAAITAGHYAQGAQNWSAHDIYLQLSEGHPVVIWVDTTFQPVGVRWWTAWDGTAIPYAVGEHAVTLTGIDVGQGTVQLLDVAHGVFDTFPMSRFESFWTTFSNMALVVD